MRSHQPPRIAVWLLRHFGSSPKNDSIIGDLNERYRQGRTCIWYWRQVTTAIISSAFTEIRSHKYVGLRAVILGLIVIHILGNLMFSLFGRLIAESLHGRLIGGTLITEGQLPFWVHPLFASVVFIVAMGSGWTIGRFHRSHQRAMVLLCGSSVLLYLFAFAIIKGIGLSPLSAGGSLALYCMNSAFVFVGILVGGAFCICPPDPTPAQDVSL